MLFVESRAAEHFVEKSLRLGVLEALQSRGHRPLIRTARLESFERALAGEGSAGDLERAVADWQDAEGDEPYVRGDLFCTETHACFLIFGEAAEGESSLRAGIVYTAETTEPGRRLEAFCRDVRDAVVAASGARVGAGEEGNDTSRSFEWLETEGGDGVAAFSQGVTQSASAYADGAQGHASATDGGRAAEMIEDSAARAFLLRLSGARTSEPSPAAGREQEEHEGLVARLAGAGLVRREVQVSCRKDGRSLFRLPSVEALSIVTASNAVCSECGRAVADERAEELLTPTPLAASLLKGGAWLANRVRGALVSLGVPERDVTERRAGEEDEAQLLASVCGERFLFLLHDGDFTATQARRALEAETEAQAARLVVVSTGRAHEDARARLREFARRRTRAGGETEVLFIEGVERVARELAPVVERVSQQALSRELFALDSAAGFNVGHMLATRFALDRRSVALEDLAASAAGALSGSLKDF